MVCAYEQKVWVHVGPHRKRVWKCFNKKPQKRRGKKITKPLNVADFVRAPGYRTSKRQEKARNKPKPKPKRIQLKPPKLIREIKARPIKNKPIKYAEDYQLQEPTQFGSKKSKRGTKDDPIVLTRSEGICCLCARW